MRSCDRPHSSLGVGSVLRASSNFRLPCGKQSFGVGCRACTVSSKYPESDQAPRACGNSIEFQGHQRNLRGRDGFPSRFTYSQGLSPSFRVCPATDPTVRQRFLQIIFGTCARLCRRGFLGVLSTSAFFRNTRCLVPRSRNRHSSSGFSVNCRSCRQETFATTVIQPNLRRPPDALLRALPCFAFRETYAHEVWCALRSFILPEEPFAISCDSCPLAVSPSILLAPSAARPKKLGRNFRVFISS